MVFYNGSDDALELLGVAQCLVNDLHAGDAGGLALLQTGLFGHLRWEPNLLSLELPATLPAKRYDLRSGLQTKQLLRLRDRQRDVGLLDAGANLLLNSHEQVLHEALVDGGGHPRLALVQTMVAALHQMLLELNTVVNVRVLKLNLVWDGLQLGVEFGDAIVGKQAEKIEADKQPASLAVRYSHSARNVSVIDLQLREIALECCAVIVLYTQEYRLL